MYKIPNGHCRQGAKKYTPLPSGQEFFSKRDQSFPTTERQNKSQTPTVLVHTLRFSSCLHALFFSPLPFSISLSLLCCTISRGLGPWRVGGVNSYVHRGGLCGSLSRKVVLSQKRHAFPFPLVLQPDLAVLSALAPTCECGHRSQAQ